ncbi:hypothetical protein AB0G74_13735 [Streptomyces sp. NPDC020875]
MKHVPKSSYTAALRDPPDGPATTGFITIAITITTGVTAATAAS